MKNDVDLEARKIEQDDVIKKKQFIQSKERMRNLHQYKGKSDEEFDEIYAKKVTGAIVSSEFEGRVSRKIDEFSKDYDLDDLNSNDKLILRNLAQAMISLEDYENVTYQLRAEGISIDNLTVLEKVEKIKDDLTKRISSMQTDLKITRKVRDSGKEQSVIEYIEDLKKKAKEFYKSRMLYVFCPKCKILLGTVWSLYPDEDRNRITFVCDRKLENDEKCGEKVVVSTKELIANGGSNAPELLAESMK